MGSLNTWYYASENCKEGEEQIRQSKNLQLCFEASRVSLQINEEALPPLEAFPYLVHSISYNNRYWEALY